MESKRKSYYNITSLGLNVIENNLNIKNEYLMNFDFFKEFKFKKNNNNSKKKKL